MRPLSDEGHAAGGFLPRGLEFQPQRSLRELDSSAACSAPPSAAPAATAADKMDDPAMHRTTTDLLAKLEAFGARSEALYGANSQLEDESGDEEEEEPLSPARWAGYEHTGPANDYAAELVERLGAAEHRPAVDVREDSRRRPQRALEKENLRASREAKPPPPGACLQINARSRELEREATLLQQERESFARRMQTLVQDLAFGRRTFFSGSVWSTPWRAGGRV